MLGADVGRLCLAGTALVLLSLGALPRAGSAEKLELGLRGSLEYDDRVFTEEDDGIARVRPKIRVIDEEGVLEWELDYRPFYEAYAEFSELNGWNHDVRAEGSWEVSPRTTVRISDRFRHLQSSRLFNEAVDEDPGGELIFDAAAENERITRNTLEASLRHSLSPQDTLVLNFSHSLLGREERDDTDTQGSDEDGGRDVTNLGLTGSYRRSVTAKTTLGLGASARSSQVEGRGEDSRTDFYQVFGTIRHRFSESLVLDLSAGPTLVSSESLESEARSIVSTPFPAQSTDRFVDATTCPTTEDGLPFLSASCEGTEPLDDPSGVTAEAIAEGATPVILPAIGTAPSADETNVSFFANGSLTKRWDEWTASLRYNRRESSTGQFGSSTISDTVSSILTWEPDPRWRFRLTGQWSRRTQAAEVLRQVTVVQALPAGSTITTDDGEVITLPPNTAQTAGVALTTREAELERTLWRARLQGSYELSNNVSLFSELVYRVETGDFAGEDDDRAQIQVGVEYSFDPIRF